MVPRNQPPHLLPANDPNNTRQTPSQTSPQLMRTTKPSFLPPPPFRLPFISMPTGIQKRLDKPPYSRGGDIQRESGENERDGETPRTQLVGDDVYQPGDLFEPEYDMALVGEVSVVLLFRVGVRVGVRVLGCCCCCCGEVVPWAVEVEREETSIWDLG